MSEDIAAGATRVLAKLDGDCGQILVLEDPITGARLYREAGVNQSYVLPGGVAGLDYIRLMAAVLCQAPSAVLFGCGGGALASELYRQGCSVTVVDTNARSFDIARRFFWMPHYIACVTDDMRRFLAQRPEPLAAIGVDLGGPGFEYGPVFDPEMCRLLGQRLSTGGIAAINIACDWAEPDTIPTIMKLLGSVGLSVVCCEEVAEVSGNAVLVAVKGPVDPATVGACAASFGFQVASASA